MEEWNRSIFLFDWRNENESAHTPITLVTWSQLVSRIASPPLPVAARRRAPPPGLPQLADQKLIRCSTCCKRQLQINRDQTKNQGRKCNFHSKQSKSKFGRSQPPPRMPNPSRSSRFRPATCESGCSLQTCSRLLLKNPARRCRASAGPHFLEPRA